MTEIKEINIKELNLAEKNPRKIDKEQFAKLCKSIQDDPSFLERRPVLVNISNGRNDVYAGNQRVRAAKKLGWESIPCIIDKDLSEDIIKSRMIKDNKTYGEFDFDMLANEWDIETLFDAGFSERELSGSFHVDEIDAEESKQETQKKTKSCPECGALIK